MLNHYSSNKFSPYHPVENWLTQCNDHLWFHYFPPRMSRCSSQYIKIIKINFVSFDVTRWQSMVQLVLIARSILMLNWGQCWGLCRLYLAPIISLWPARPPPGDRALAPQPPQCSDISRYCCSPHRPAPDQSPSTMAPSTSAVWSPIWGSRWEVDYTDEGCRIYVVVV